MSRSGLSRPGNGEKEDHRLSELRGKRGRGRLNIEVRDLREGRDAASAVGTSPGGAGPELSKGQFFNAVKPVHTEIEIPVDLRLSEGGQEAAAGKTGNASRNLTFEDALASELRGNLATDIVRDATLIVRNGGEGTIRLTLHPASLGNVKIRLEMTENKITGHIIVESKEALRAFQRELPVLEKAFRDSGFSETNLDMSLAQDGANSGAGQQWQEGDNSGLSSLLAASRYDAGLGGSDGADGAGRTEDSPVPGGVTSSAAPGRKAVNLLV
jgi:hypothetical protein